MDSGELLDLLGNDNRRQILRLLAEKPCYVTEIGEYLGVSPKAIIDHLERLEDAGLVESYVGDQRRKYYAISENLRLEVRVSPFGYGVKSAYPASSRLDITSWRYLTVDVEPETNSELPELIRHIDRLEQLERELSMAQRWVQGRLTDLQERLAERVGDGRVRPYREVLRTLAEGPASATRLRREADLPHDAVTRVLEDLREDGVVERTDDGWRLRD